jgi:hypothetical protein
VEGVKDADNRDRMTDAMWNGDRESHKSADDFNCSNACSVV